MTAAPTAAIAPASLNVGITPITSAVLTANEAWSRAFAITGINANPIWSLAQGSPDGVAIDSRSGILTWTPQSGQAGQTFSVTVSARYGNSSSSVVSATVELSVAPLAQTPAPEPPTILKVVDLQVAVGDAVCVRIEATSNSIPADRLRFALVGDAQDGAVIDPVTGVFEWKSTPGDLIRWFGVRVYDVQNPQVASEILFPVKVLGGSNASLLNFDVSDRTKFAPKPVSIPLPPRMTAAVKPKFVNPAVNAAQPPAVSPPRTLPGQIPPRK